MKKKLLHVQIPYALHCNHEIKKLKKLFINISSKKKKNKQVFEYFHELSYISQPLNFRYIKNENRSNLLDTKV